MAYEELDLLARQIRAYILESTTTAGSGHATSALSAVDVITTLFFRYFRYDFKHPKNPNNDTFILSKGHASPLLYSILTTAGVISEKELLTLRTFGSRLEGHPVPGIPLVDTATGSLGQGLSIAIGMSLAMKVKSLQHSVSSSQKNEIEFQNKSENPLTTIAIPDSLSTINNKLFTIPRIYVLMGDGECAEGQVWEAVASASELHIDNIIAIVDINRLGQSGSTSLAWDMDTWRKRFESFGWGVICIDGHEFNEIIAAFDKATVHKGGPTVILAKTIKGKGVIEFENKEGMHGVPLPKEKLVSAIEAFHLPKKKVIGKVQIPNDKYQISHLIQNSKNNNISTNNKQQTTNYSQPTATRQAFGNALVRLGTVYYDMVVLDCDMQNSTYTELFNAKFPDRFFQMYIREQHTISVAEGMYHRGLIPWISQFSSFLVTRGYDQIRMAALSGATVKINGSHGGVSIGQDGGSQMGLNDLAIMRAIPGSTVVYPADAYATERLVNELMNVEGISYIRTQRPKTPIIYTEKDLFPIGGSKVHDLEITNNKLQITNKFKKQNLKSKIQMKTSKANNLLLVTIYCCGITVTEALKAQKELSEQGLTLRVVDCYSIKPLDEKTVVKTALSSGKVIIAEDHYPEGGLGDGVKSALAGKYQGPITHLAVRKRPTSGTPEELLCDQGIDMEGIMKAVLN
jgi:transketolase